MTLLNRIAFIIIALLYFTDSYAQGGGPPMITDDPGTLNKHKWEINTSINSTITNDVQLSTPYVDANYGLTNNFQLKVEAPYLITIDKQQHSSGALGNVLLGLKIHFLNEDKDFVDAGTYPQLTVNGDQKGFLLPLLLQKMFGNFLIGEDFGNFFGDHNYNSIQNGLLFGYTVSKRFQVMGEYFLQQNYGASTATAGFMNYGFRYMFNATFTLLGSAGSQVVNSVGEQRQYFISFLGLQSDF